MKINKLATDQWGIDNYLTGGCPIDVLLIIFRNSHTKLLLLPTNSEKPLKTIFIVI